MASLGQYFTTNDILKEKLYEFIQNAPTNILEPSVGRGDLVKFLTEKNPEVAFDMYEIDTTIELLPQIPRENVIWGDFLEQSISKKYKTIVGNPPYVRTKRGNLYIDFIEKCVDLLDDSDGGGELIFIIPADFFKLTCAVKILHKMMSGGAFTHIYHPHNERMFDGAAIDIIIFRYCKSPPPSPAPPRVLYNDVPLYIINNNGCITFHETLTENVIPISEYFDVYVGLVNGKEDVYKHAELGNISVLNAGNKYDKYIYIENYPCDDEKINTYLLKHKPRLMERKIKKMTEKNWFEWGAPRNIKIMEKNRGKECIYIHTMTRQHTSVAFVGTVGYFGGGLIMLYPKKKCDLARVVSYLNSADFTKNFMFSGRFKTGHRQICNSRFPIPDPAYLV